VAPYDWKNFLSTRVNQATPRAPLDGITKGGWRLVYTDARNDFLKNNDDDRQDVAYSIGLRIRPRDGVVADVILDSPAGKTGLAPGMQILAVNGVRYSADVLRNAVKDSKTKSGPLMLEVQNDDVVKSVPLDYHGGAREPHLERDGSKPDVLGQILASRAK